MSDESASGVCSLAMGRHDLFSRSFGSYAIHRGSASVC